MAERDPRIYFAAERTLLAWVRSGLTVIGLGFIVARFALFLRIANGQRGDFSPGGATWIGILLVVLGSAALAMAAWQHVRFCRALQIEERPTPYWTGWSVWFAFGLAFAGLVLAIYILVSSPIAFDPSVSVE